MLAGQWLVTTISTERLRGSHDAVVDGVSPLASPEGRGLRVAFAAMKGGGVTPGAERGWPLPEKSERSRVVPLRGYTIRPGELGLILVRVASTRLGRGGFAGFVIRYHVRSTYYHATFREGIYLDVRRTCPICERAASGA